MTIIKEQQVKSKDVQEDSGVICTQMDSLSGSTSVKVTSPKEMGDSRLECGIEVDSCLVEEAADNVSSVEGMGDNLVTKEKCESVKDECLNKDVDIEVTSIESMGDNLVTKEKYESIKEECLSKNVDVEVTLVESMGDNLVIKEKCESVKEECLSKDVDVEVTSVESMGDNLVTKEKCESVKEECLRNDVDVEVTPIEGLRDNLVSKEKFENMVDECFSKNVDVEVTSIKESKIIKDESLKSDKVSGKNVIVASEEVDDLETPKVSLREKFSDSNHSEFKDANKSIGKDTDIYDDESIHNEDTREKQLAVDTNAINKHEKFETKDGKKHKMVNIAVRAATDGNWSQMYEDLEATDVKVDLVLVCGNLRSARCDQDEHSTAIAEHRKFTSDFIDYYHGVKTAPVLTIVTFGADEAMRYLRELPYGGWIANNIYYLGYAGVVEWAGLRIVGLSGIYKKTSFDLGRYERTNLSFRECRTARHTRNLEVYQLKQITKQADIFISYDWGFEYKKPGDELRKNLLYTIQPKTSYSVLSSRVKAQGQELVISKFGHESEIKKHDVLNIEVSCDRDLKKLNYNKEWLIILNRTRELVGVDKKVVTLDKLKQKFEITPDNYESLKKYMNDTEVPEYCEEKEIEEDIYSDFRVNHQTTRLRKSLRLVDVNAVRNNVQRYTSPDNDESDNSYDKCAFSKENNETNVNTNDSQTSATSTKPDNEIAADELKEVTRKSRDPDYNLTITEGKIARGAKYAETKKINKCASLKAAEVDVKPREPKFGSNTRKLSETKDSNERKEKLSVQISHVNETVIIPTETKPCSMLFSDKVKNVKPSHKDEILDKKSLVKTPDTQISTKKLYSSVLSDSRKLSGVWTKPNLNEENLMQTYNNNIYIRNNIKEAASELVFDPVESVETNIKSNINKVKNSELPNSSKLKIKSTEKPISADNGLYSSMFANYPDKSGVWIKPNINKEKNIPPNNIKINHKLHGDMSELVFTDSVKTNMKSNTSKVKNNKSYPKSLI